MGVYTTEIASDTIASDNPIHQRLLKPYEIVAEMSLGEVLEIGCGEGRGVEAIMERATSYTAIDKIGEVVDRLTEKYPKATFKQVVIPPFEGIESDKYDTVVSFQVIEHIQNDSAYLKEIFRVLKPGGTAYITTPNIEKTLTRNPWHIREYTSSQLLDLAKSVFTSAEMKGIGGNDKIWEYYERNKVGVKKITRFDIFNLQYRLPASLLRIPYDLLNRLNRNNLKETNDELVKSITSSDYLYMETAENALDLFLIAKK